MTPRHEAERRMSKRRNRNKDQEYIYERQKIDRMGLSPAAYEYAIRQMCKRIGY